MADTPAVPESSSKSTSASGVKNFFRRLLGIPEAGVLVPLLGFVLIFYIINPVFLSPISITTMLRSMSFIGVIALGQTLLMISGAFDLSVGSTAGLASIVCSYVMVKMQLPIPVAILAGLGTGALVGLVNSFSVLKLGVPAFIATLGMLYIAKGITFLISKGYTIYPLPPAIKTFGTAEPFGTSWSFVIFIVLAVIAHIVLSKTSFGRKLYVVGGNQEVARLAGISPARYPDGGFCLGWLLVSFERHAVDVAHRHRKSDHWIRLGVERHRRCCDRWRQPVWRRGFDPWSGVGLAHHAGCHQRSGDFRRRPLLADRLGRRNHDHCSGDRRSTP